MAFKPSNRPSGKRKPFGKKSFGSSHSRDNPRHAPRDDRRDAPHRGARPSRPASRSASVPQESLLEVKVTGFTPDGEPFALPTNPRLAGDYPRIIIDPTQPVNVGDVLQVELTELTRGTFLANVIRKGAAPPERPLAGIFKAYGERFMPLRRDLNAIDFSVENAHGLKEGQVILAAVGRRPASGPTPVKMLEVLGDSIVGLESLVAINNHAIPHAFPPEVVTEAEALPAFTTLGAREDLRQLPIVTIDGADAKDFDDAVYAEQLRDGGFHIIVAIADVAFYIQPGTRLNEEALQRGNSVYFPDRVVPMLPERLSNDLCSLRPHEDRPVLAVHIHLNSRGDLLKYNFTRAVIHSAARLTYEQVQYALDGTPDTTTKPLLEPVIKPLYAAYKLLLSVREKRGAIDLDIPESKVVMNGTDIHTIDRRLRLDSHKLIEELMILANVTAGLALQTRGTPGLYRIHDRPTPEKLNTLSVLLENQGIPFKITAAPTPMQFQQLAKKLKSHTAAEVLMRSVLQTQQQARYSPDNIGHFGLALPTYAHFTSPIRRYSDLVVHRALISALRLADHGGWVESASQLHAWGDHLCITERRAQQAEWEARDRLTARFYSKEIGSTFEARVTSIQRFGVFVSIQNGIAEGLVPMRLLQEEKWHYDTNAQLLRAGRSGRTLRVGDTLVVKLHEADPIAARLTFTPVITTSAGNTVPEKPGHKKHFPPRSNKDFRKPFKPRRD